MWLAVATTFLQTWAGKNCPNIDAFARPFEGNSYAFSVDDAFRFAAYYAYTVICIPVDQRRINEEETEEETAAATNDISMESTWVLKPSSGIGCLLCAYVTHAN